MIMQDTITNNGRYDNFMKKCTIHNTKKKHISKSFAQYDALKLHIRMYNF